ncbi:MAG: hypothetical protein H0X72_07335 [Acidobacteria bacterium]|jgi:hypothetical protein|nr:hypothetical protein [Acidobacteriota bacterium]
MKVLYAVTMLFLLAAAAWAQALLNPSDTSNVIIVQRKWRLEVRNPALDEDPLRANNEQRQAEYDRKEYMRKNELRIRQGKSPEIAPPPRKNTSERAVSNYVTRYIYELKIKNNGEKTIRAILWEYVFFEPGTEAIVGQRQFISKVSISPGKTKNIVAHSASPPTETIDATKAGDKSRELYSEQIVIQSIEYEDGSLWKANSK